MYVLLEEIDVADEGLLFELGFVNHENGNLLIVQGGSCQKMHVVLCGGDLTENVVFYLLAFEVHEGFKLI